MGLWNKLFGKKPTEAKEIQPEDLYIVDLTDTHIKVTHPNGANEAIRWADIEAIKLVNTDEGPLLPDVWMVLAGNGKGCAIPQGSKGWDMVYDIVSKYDGFNFENVIRSAGTTDNAVFELWKK